MSHLLNEAELDYGAACRLHERLPDWLLSIPTDEDLERELEQRAAKRPQRKIGFRAPAGKAIPPRKDVGERLESLEADVRTLKTDSTREVEKLAQERFDELCDDTAAEHEQEIGKP